MVILSGSKVDATDFAYPDVATGYANGTNTITATSFANLPTTPCSASIVNPHPESAMLVLVILSAWMQASTNAVRAGVAVSGSTTISAGIGGGGMSGWGEVLRAPANGTSAQYSSPFTVELPVSAAAATFTVQAYVEASGGTQQVNYPTLRLIPIRYV